MRRAPRDAWLGRSEVTESGAPHTPTMRLGAVTFWALIFLETDTRWGARGVRTLWRSGYIVTDVSR